MNIIMTDRRNSILIEQASALTFISSVGPPLNKFNPEQCVKSWLWAGRRSADETAVGSEMLQRTSLSINPYGSSCNKDEFPQICFSD
jgi:hypothetical protein